MTVAHALPPVYWYSADATASASSVGKEVAKGLIQRMSRYTTIAPLRDASLEERLGASWQSAKRAVNAHARYLGRDAARRISNQLSPLFDPNEWESDDVVPGYESASSVLSAVVAIGAVPTSMGISRTGNLTALWRIGPQAVSVEGLPTGRISWAVAEETTVEIKHASGKNGMVADLLGALA